MPRSGWHPGEPVAPSAELERDALRRQADSLELELQQIRQRLDDLAEEPSEAKK